MLARSSGSAFLLIRDHPRPARQTNTNPTTQPTAKPRDTIKNKTWQVVRDLYRKDRKLSLPSFPAVVKNPSRPPLIPPQPDRPSQLLPRRVPLPRTPMQCHPLLALALPVEQMPKLSVFTKTIAIWKSPMTRTRSIPTTTMTTNHPHMLLVDAAARIPVLPRPRQIL